VVKTELSARAKSILDAVLREFIATGEPVSSRTLARRYPFELSPATIRNIMADLEEWGYLMQPHTSAGRVPTRAAFRWFIDGLGRSRGLSERDAERVGQWLDGLEPDVDLLRSTGRFLSELTGSCAVVARRRTETRLLVKMRFVEIRPLELLAVVVFDDGTVENRFVHVGAPLGRNQLERLHELLDEVILGRSLAEARRYLAELCEQGRTELEHLTALEGSLVTAALRISATDSEVIVEGQARLLDDPKLYEPRDARELMRSLEDREFLVGMLDRALAAKEVQVYLGDELEEDAAATFSMVLAPFRGHAGELAGAVGVVGPTRMDYPVVVPLVGATAEAMGQVLARSERGATVSAPEETEPSPSGS
jgi:heat-inducible transcriptional repressor